jgi:hypothetical protein
MPHAPDAPTERAGWGKSLAVRSPCGRSRPSSRALRAFTPVFAGYGGAYAILPTRQDRLARRCPPYFPVFTPLPRAPRPRPARPWRRNT